MSQQSAQEEQHSVQEFAEQFVESLQPREERYETRLGDDFYVCTWPNGIKTWLFVYEVDGYRRRRTLGTYPEMSLTDAREALFAARKLQRAEEALIEMGLGDAVMRSGSGPERVERRDRPQEQRTGAPLGVRIARTLGTAAVGAVLAIGGMFGYGMLTTPSKVQLPGATSNSTAGTQNRLAGATPAEPGASPGRDPGAGAVGTGTPRGTEADAAATGNGAPGRGRTDPESAGADAGSAAGTGRAEAPAAAGEGSGGTAPIQDPRLRELQAALAGTVSRALLTGSVTDGKPGTMLPDLIRIPPGGSRAVSFFTEVRGMQDQQFEHRWIHDGELVETVALRTPPSGWHLPLASSLRLQSGLHEGRWIVELRDARGELLEDLFFTVEAGSDDGD